MTDCIICMESFSQEHIITSSCNHGPYCHTCYNNITSPPNPKCAICRGVLARSNNPNALYANNNNNLHNDFNLHRFIIEGAINQGTYVNQVNQVNQVNHINHHGPNGFTTPPRTRPMALPELNQEVIYANYRRRTADLAHGIQFNQMMIEEQ